MRRWRAPIALLPLCLALSACGIFGGSEPAHRPAKLTPIKNPQIKAKVIWRRGLGDGPDGLFSALRPTVNDEAVFAADTHGNVWAFNRKNGHTLWKTDTHLRLLSGPSLADGLVLVGGQEGHVVALDPKDGSQRWRVQMSSEVLSAPAGADGIVVVRCVDGVVYGLSTADGSRRWSFSRNEPRLTLRGTSKPLIANGDAIIGLDNGKVAALALDTGEVDWQTVIAVPSGASELEQLVDVDGRLAKEGDDLFAASYGKQLAALDLESGRVLWRHKIASYSGVTSGKDALYVSAIDSTVISLDRITGSVYWKNGALSYRGISRPVIQGDYVLVNDREGYLHWFTQDGGKLAGRIQLEDVGFASAPVVEGHLVYVEADNGRLSAVKMSPIRQKASGGTNEKGASKKGSAGSAAITPLQDHDHDSSGDFFEPPLKQSPPSR